MVEKVETLMDELLDPEDVWCPEILLKQDKDSAIRFSKTMKELDLRWKKDDPIKMYRDLRMPQFEITNIVDSICQESFHIGNYSCLVAEFHMRRSLGFHLVQSYLPTILTVAISWVSLWMDIGSAPGRTTLGVTTLLTISSKSSEIQGDLPQVSYVKAIDVWMGACTAFVFCALLEFTLANYMWRKPPKVPAPKSMDGLRNIKAQDLTHDCMPTNTSRKTASNASTATARLISTRAWTPISSPSRKGTLRFVLSLYGHRRSMSTGHVSGRVPMVNDLSLLAPHLLANVSTNSSKDLALAIDSHCRVLFPFNCNGIQSSTVELATYLAENDVAVACLQETKLSAASRPPSFPGYALERRVTAPEVTAAVSSS
ncbi:gamma-aminobutyric acid receptor subunit beta-like [Hyalella azteca]|uniref:Gamma-aminobutyric acid receptor subunit beta-like n=1 Tax=Hyalella azteca TaxID=294128 RepID=A0A979FMG7_HYAAZ|nr:gamma-aminobutyric acid receptor subunit beta-like [Hyalella azteca]